MTEENNESKKPLFYIFEEISKGKTVYMGEAFPHKNGNGFNINIADRTYLAFPPKKKDTPKPNT